MNYLKKILCEICSYLPKVKKDNLFKRLTDNITFDNNNYNIEYISKLSEACVQNIIPIDENNEDKNYYGLDLLFNYIIKDFNEKKKYNENNVDQAMEAFYSVIRKNNYYFDIEDILLFIDKLFDNIKSNNKHNSVIQSLKLLRKLYYNIKKNESIIECTKNLDKKYSIISLLINDLIR